MQANLVVAVALEAAAPIVASGAADFTLYETAFVSTPLALPGTAPVTLIETGVASAAIGLIAVDDPARPTQFAIGPVYTPAAPVLANPQFTRNEGLLARIDYDGPHAKIFAYANGRLATLDYSDGFRTLRKSFSYDASGALASIAEGYV